MAAILSLAVARPLTPFRRFPANETDPWSCPCEIVVWCWCWCELCGFTWSFNRSSSTGENPCTIWIGTNLFEIPMPNERENTHKNWSIVNFKFHRREKNLWVWRNVQKKKSVTQLLQGIKQIMNEEVRKWNFIEKFWSHFQLYAYLFYL